MAEAVVVQEASTELVTVPAVYETITETIEIQADGSTRVISSETVPSPTAPTLAASSGFTSSAARPTSVVVAPTSASVTTGKTSGGISSVSSLHSKIRPDGGASTASRAESGSSSWSASGSDEIAAFGTVASAPSAPVTSAPAEVYDDVIVTGASRKRGGLSKIFSPIGKVFKGKSKDASRVAAPPPPAPVAPAVDVAEAKPVTASPHGEFTVFNGISNVTVKATETKVSSTGEILCRVIIPAQYKTITKQVVKSPARAEKVIIPAVTKDITVKLANPDGSFREVIRQVIIEEEAVDYIIIPAEYETRTERVLVAPAREEWKPDSERIVKAPKMPKPPKPKPRPGPQSGLLTAGDYDDVLNPDLYKVYLDKMLQGHLTGKDLPYVDANQRINIRVVDRFGKAVPAANISLTNASGKTLFPLRTGADGMAYLYPNFDDLQRGMRLKVSAKGARTVSQSLTEQLIQTGGDMKFNLSMSAQPVDSLDLLLTIDSTGSMGDEMRYLQTELKAIVGRVEQANPGINIRTGLIVYRDEGDQYVVREIPFTDDIDDFRKSLGEQRAGGGGDTPEAMHTAMVAGLQNMDWRKDAIKVNLLVADAPPHDRHIAETWDAGLLSRANGIHIVPLAASGVDKTAEFLMRSMAQITGGRYLFLTDDSGIGNPHAKPTVDCYIVTRLDGLVTRTLSSLIKGERVEPEAGEVIRSVGNYWSGVCDIDQALVPLNVSLREGQ